MGTGTVFSPLNAVPDTGLTVTDATLPLTVGTRVTMTPSIGRLALAMAKAQRAVDTARKDSRNPHFNSKYADLASIYEACRDALTEQEIAIVQSPSAEGNRVTITTILMHSSGEYIVGSLELAAVKPDPQGVGSAITYGRRYALAAIVGIAQEDDDGNAASGGGAPAKRQAQRQAPQEPKNDPPAVSLDATKLMGELKALRLEEQRLGGHPPNIGTPSQVAALGVDALTPLISATKTRIADLKAKSQPAKSAEQIVRERPV
jgi:hypothetical protein